MEQDQISASSLLCFDESQFLIVKSNGDDPLPVTTEEDDDAVFSGYSLPGDLAEEDEEEEWSGENPYCFYFVKQFAYDDPEIKSKIDEADNEIYHCNNDRIHIANRLKSKRAERLSLVASMESLISSFAINKDKEVEEEEEVEIYSLSERLSEIKMEIELLNVQMGYVLDQRDKAFEKIKILRIQRDKGNAAFFQSRVVMKKAIELASSGNVRDLEELSSSEVDKFMSRWNNDKAFRDDYKKRTRRDRQIRDSEGNVDTELGNETVGKKTIELKRFSSEESDDFNVLVYEKLEKTDEETLKKKKKREEQLEKARLAMERKRKLHEKATAKAAIRIKKEAEKKLKDLEKRSKKKKALINSSSSTCSSDVDRTMDIVTGKSEVEKEKVLNGKSVFPKQRSFNVPKAIIKRRKAYRLWVWTVSSAAFVLSTALIAVFFYIR